MMILNYYSSLKQTLVLLKLYLWKMEIMLQFGSWTQAQHDWQHIISVEKAIPILWFLWFSSVKLGVCLWSKGKELALIWKILLGVEEHGKQ